MVAKVHAAVLLAALEIAVGAPMASAGVRFHPPVLYHAGLEGTYGPGDLAAGDFNGDGLVDIASADAAMGPGSVSVLLGRGDGTMNEATVYEIGTRPLSIAVGDFDDDGLDDLVVPVDGENSVELWLSEGDATFVATSHAVSPLLSPNAVAAGDFDGDGNLDAAVAGAGMAIALLLGVGDGDLEEPKQYAAGGAGFGTIAAGDVNADGRDDVVAAPGPASSVAVFLGQGDGTLGAPVATSVDPCCPSQLVVGRVNGDAADDVVVSYAFEPSADLLLGVSGGTLSSPVAAGEWATAASAALGDFDGDGRNDLIAASFGGRVTLHLGAGDGTFGPGSTFAPGGALGLPLTVDLNRDGFDDVAVSEGLSRTIGIAINGPAGIATPSALAYPVTRPGTLAGAQVVRLTNDGSPPLRLGRLVIAGANPIDFHLLDDTCSGRILPAGDGCTATIAFGPIGPGERSGFLEVPGNGIGGASRVPLSGVSLPANGVTVDTEPPRLELSRLSRRLGRVLRRGVEFRARCSEACKIRAELVVPRKVARRLGLGGSRAFPAGHATKKLAAGVEATVRVKLRARVRASLRNVRKVTLTLKVWAGDAVGNDKRVTRHLTLQRR